MSGALGVTGGLVVVLLAMLALREVAALVVPVLFGLFLALVTAPLVGAFERRGAGHGLALAGAIGVVLLVVLVAVGVVAFSVSELVDLVPRYEDRLAELIAEVRARLASFGITADPEALPGVVSPGSLGSIVQSVASGVSRAAGAIAILALTLVYALTGGSSLRLRAEAAFGRRHALLDGVERFGSDLRRFLLVRAELGLFAAVLVFVMLVLLGVPLPALWAALTFAASFIPNIGTLIALVPPTLMAVLDSGLGAGVAVVVGYTVINFAQDYLLQPRMMGTELNLSPLVVFLSVVVWAWILGAAGALLAVPLTVGVVAVLEAFPSSRGVAMLLRNKVESEPGIVDDAAEAARAATD